MAQEKTLHFAGSGVGHSIAPPMHNFIAKSLKLPWTFFPTECETVEDAVMLAKKDSTVGLVVTMPHKSTIMQHIDDLDDLAITMGACTHVYRDPKDPTRLCGTNTDYLGVKGCLLEKGSPVLNKPALIVGAGGAGRATVYTLSSDFGASVIYVLNRDDGEVADLARDSQRLTPTPNIIHVKTEAQAKALKTPHYVVGCVPDFEPKTPGELSVRTSLVDFLSRPEKGVLLDLCYKPRRTRMAKLAEQLGWPTVEGTHVIGYQIERQWALWVGEERMKMLDKEGAWRVLLETAEQSPSINF